MIGGDGTQTAAVGEIAHSKSVLAVVPSGTGNSFALSLGIEADIEKALEVIVGGRELRVDVGMVNGTYFANFATIGLIAEAAERTAKPLKRIIGPLAYGIAAIAPLLRRKPFRLQVKWPGNDLTVATHQAIVTSGRYYGWQPLTPQAGPRSGELAFFTAAGTTALDAIETNAALLRGEQAKPGARAFLFRTAAEDRLQAETAVEYRRARVGKHAGKIQNRPESVTRAGPARFRSMIGGPLAGLFVIAAILVAACVALGAAICARPPGAWDARLARARGQATRLALAFTLSGRSRALLIGYAAAIAVYAAARLPLWIPLILALAQIASQTAVELLKKQYRRARPDYWLVGLDAGHSYPSGHATTAVVSFGGWALVAAHSLHGPVGFMCAVILSLWAIGIVWSRLALGAHYLSDVVGGLLFGAGWLCALVAVAGTTSLTR